MLPTIIKSSPNYRVLKQELKIGNAAVHLSKYALLLIMECLLS